MRISDWSSDVCSSDLLCLNRPDRHNALVPELLDDILAAIETCRREAGRDGGPDAPIPPRVLVLTAKGKSFRSEEHTSELQSLMRISYAVFCLKKKKKLLYTTNQTFKPLLHSSHKHTQVQDTYIDTKTRNNK